MDRAKKIQVKLKKILKRLKGLGIIKTFKLEINFCPLDRNLIKYLLEIDSALKKCLRKIIIKPKRAEIRNVINELVKKKNLNRFNISQEEVTSKNLYFTSKRSEKLAEKSLEFSCGFCGKMFDSKRSFAAHKKLHLKFETKLCEKCGEIFQGSRKWHEHLSSVDKNTGMCFSLKNCQQNARFDKPSFTVSAKIATKIKECEPSDLNVNFGNHSEEKNEEKNYSCTCGKVFKIWKSFKKHEKVKHSLFNTKYICQSCGKSFIEKGKLNRHILSHKDGQYSCSLCSKLFSRSDTLKRHLSMCHYNSEEFTCSFCEKKFKLKYNKDVHEKNVHRNANDWIHCGYCEQRLRNKISLKNHLKTHLGTKITCTVCSKSFARKSYYENHVKSKHLSHQEHSSGFKSL